MSFPFWGANGIVVASKCQYWVGIELNSREVSDTK